MKLIIAILTAKIVFTKLLMPYVDVLMNDPYTNKRFDLSDAVQKTGIKGAILCFFNYDNAQNRMVIGAKAPQPLDSINSWIAEARNSGLVDLAISFGGVDQTLNVAEPAYFILDISKLVSVYQTVIDQFKPTMIDFNIEQESFANQDVLNRRIKALIEIRKNNPELKISLTLPATTGRDNNGGFLDFGIKVVKAATNQNFIFDCIFFLIRH